MNSNYEHYNSLENLLLKFSDGKKKYLESPIFHQTIMMLLNDVDKMSIISSLLDVIEKYDLEINNLHKKNL